MIIVISIECLSQSSEKTYVRFINEMRINVVVKNLYLRQGHAPKPFLRRLHFDIISSRTSTMTKSFLFILSLFLGILSTNGFVSPSVSKPVALIQNKHDSILSIPKASVLAAKKPQMDLSDIESRDMTREEMIELNKQNEDIMNMELSMMTGFSLIISLPILYLCWVAFFSE